MSTPSPKPLEPRLAVMIVVTALFVAGCLSDFGPPTATFNGTRCSYSGLEEFSFDDGLVTFTFDNKSSGQAGIAIWKIPATTPTDDFNDIAPTAPVPIWSRTPTCTLPTRHLQASQCPSRC